MSPSEFDRYFCVGSLAFLTGFTTLFLLTEIFSIKYLWSNLVTVSVGLLMSYLFCVQCVSLACRYIRVVFYV